MTKHNPATWCNYVSPMCTKRIQISASDVTMRSYWLMGTGDTSRQRKSFLLDGATRRFGYCVRVHIILSHDVIVRVANSRDQITPISSRALQMMCTAEEVGRVQGIGDRGNVSPDFVWGRTRPVKNDFVFNRRRIQLRCGWQLRAFRRSRLVVERFPFNVLSLSRNSSNLYQHALSSLSRKYVLLVSIHSYTSLSLYVIITVGDLFGQLYIHIYT